MNIFELKKRRPTIRYVKFIKAEEGMITHEIGVLMQIGQKQLVRIGHRRKFVGGIKRMVIKLKTGQVYDSAIVDHVIVMCIDEGQTDEQILSDFAEESKEEVKKRLVAFRRGNELYGG